MAATSLKRYSQRRQWMHTASQLAESVDAGSILSSSSLTLTPESTWRSDAEEHRSHMTRLLYPPGKRMKTRIHEVKDNPFYNFLHRYYRYSTEEVFKFSPGLGHGLVSVQENDPDVSPRLLSFSSNGLYAFYDKRRLLNQMSEDGWYRNACLPSNRDILSRSLARAPFLSCFGMHEWAMLYSGRNKPGGKPLPRHQSHLPLRVSEQQIDDVVESGMLKCTHFDAFRFFHPNAKEMNMLPVLRRDTQKVYEQPGCLHTTMDLFKYAYELYPLVSSALLRRTLEIALWARRIDVLASPYDSSKYADGQPPIPVETADGRRQYAAEQESLSKAARLVRQELLAVYEEVLHTGGNES